jgi:hypothetical protein
MNYSTLSFACFIKAYLSAAFLSKFSKFTFTCSNYFGELNPLDISAICLDLNFQMSLSAAPFSRTIAVLLPKSFTISDGSYFWEVSREASTDWLIFFFRFKLPCYINLFPYLYLFFSYFC